MARRPVCGDWACQSHATFVARRSVFQAHPRRKYELAILRDAVVWLLLIFAACVLWPVPG